MPVHTRERGSSPGFDGVKIKCYYYIIIINDMCALPNLFGLARVIGGIVNISPNKQSCYMLNHVG